jgi:histidyl-tRNA synthetase
MIFQLFSGKEKIGGGGRYDALIPSMGGGDVPASGFAIYLDRLMNLVKTEAIAQPVPQKILIKLISGGSAKEAFKMADSLRKAGYIAELDLDGREAGWTIEVKSGAPAFTLVDKIKSKKIGAKSVDEVLKLLEDKGAD